MVRSSTAQEHSQLTSVFWPAYWTIQFHPGYTLFYPENPEITQTVQSAKRKATADKYITMLKIIA